MSGMTLTAMIVVAGFVAVTPDPTMSRLSVPRPPQDRVAQPTPGGPFIDAGIGNCSTDFAVKNAAGQPVAGAAITMHIRYGLMGLRRMDLSLGTGSDGHARVNGLPESASQLLFDIAKGGTTTQVVQDLSRACRGSYAITLK